MGQLDKLERRIEAILFATGDPLEGRKIAQILSVEESAVHKLVARIRDRYKSYTSPIDVFYLDGAYQMGTHREYAADIQTAFEIGKNTTLSSAAMEVLAVVAYNQPVTRAFVEQVRGVDCSSLLRGLVEKELVEEAGRMNIPGKPIIYKTTAVFLRSFGLQELDQLPTLPQSTAEEEELQVEGQIDFYQEDESIDSSL